MQPNQSICNSLLRWFIVWGMAFWSMSGSAALFEFNAELLGQEGQSLFSHEQEASRQQLRTAEAALKEGDFALALAQAQILVGDHPANFQGHLLLCFAWVGLGDDLSLQTHLAELETVFPALADTVKLNLARYYRDNRQYYRAQRLLTHSFHEEQLPQRWLILAQVYEAQRRLPEAVAANQALLAHAQHKAQALSALARLALLQDDYDQTLVYVRQYLQHAPHDRDMDFIQATAHLLGGEPGAAAVEFAALAAADPEDLRAASFAIVAQALTGETLDAARHFNTLWKSLAGQKSASGRLFELLYIGMWLNLRAGDRDAAKALMPLLLQENNQDPLTHLFYVALNGQGMSTAALARHMEKASALVIDLAHADLQALKLTSAAALLDAAEAALWYRQGLHFYVVEHHTRASNYLSRIYAARSEWQAGNTKQALAHYEAIAKAFAPALAAHLEQADLAFFEQRYDRAIAIYKEAWAQHPAQTDLGVRLADLYNQTGHTREALALYQTLLAAQPSAYLYNQLGATYAEKELMPENALVYAKKATTAEPDNLRYRETLAHAYFMVKQYDKARELYESMLAATGYEQSPQTFYRMAQVYDALGNWPQARLFYELAVNPQQAFAGLAQAEERLLALWRMPATDGASDSGAQATATPARR